MRILVLSLLTLCAILSTAQAQFPTRLSALRDLICFYETRGHPNPVDAIGTAGELGLCQIKSGTAHQVGYRGTNRALLIAHTSKATALKIIRRCATSRGPEQIRRIIWCYRNGFASGTRDTADRYTKFVEMEFARWVMANRLTLVKD